MTREEIIKKTLHALTVLPADKAEAISDYAGYILKKYEEHILQDGLQKLQVDGEAFQFLNEEENIYSASDLKEKF